MCATVVNDNQAALTEQHRGAPVGVLLSTHRVADLRGFCGPAEALTWPRPTDSVTQLPEADDHSRVTWRNHGGPPALSNSAQIAAGYALLVQGGFSAADRRRTVSSGAAAARFSFTLA
jgi:hypothetical protein